MSDVVFVAVVIAFFVIAVLSVRACELILGRRSAVESEREA